MSILNFGSLNIDHVYQVPHFVRPGETISSYGYRQFAGGKGFNQSLALARAGAAVHHAGKIGPDGVWLLDILRQAGANTDYVAQGQTATGHALIQVEPGGENAILLFGGANQEILPADVDRVLANFSAGDFLLLQNEISQVDLLLKKGAARGLRIVFNPAPMEDRVLTYALPLVSLLIVNETEAQALSGASDPAAMAAGIRRRFPNAAVVLTLGAAGVLYEDDDLQVHIPAEQVQAVDTTAAGDTFTGYLLAGLAAGDPVERALRLATRAAALCVTRAGAADSIPTRAEVERF